MTMLALMMAPRIPALVILFPFATGASSCGVDPSVDDVLRYLSFAVQRSNLGLLTIYPAKTDIAISPSRSNRERIAAKLHRYDHVRLLCAHDGRP